MIEIFKRYFQKSECGSKPARMYTILCTKFIFQTCIQILFMSCFNADIVNFKKREFLNVNFFLSSVTV